MKKYPYTITISLENKTNENKTLHLLEFGTDIPLEINNHNNEEIVLKTLKPTPNNNYFHLLNDISINPITIKGFKIEPYIARNIVISNRNKNNLTEKNVSYDVTKNEEFNVNGNSCIKILIYPNEIIKVRLRVFKRYEKDTSGDYIESEYHLGEL